MDSQYFLLTTHSLLRYLVILVVGYAGIIHLVGLLQPRPILVGDRLAAIVAVVICHVQLLLGLALYIPRLANYDTENTADRFWKYEHAGAMIIAITLVTLGRALSKRAKQERAKQLRLAVFFLIALALMLWATPWPFTEMGHGRRWF